MMKRCVTRSGEDISVDVRMSVMAVGGEHYISCLADFHGPHTWELPVAGGHGRFDASESLITEEDLPALLDIPELPRASSSSQEPLPSPPAPAAAAASGSQRRRIPLPRDAVLELRAMLEVNRYPEPEVREEFAARRGIDRKRVDRWLENARARETAKTTQQQQQQQQHQMRQQVQVPEETV